MDPFPEIENLIHTTPFHFIEFVESQDALIEQIRLRR